MDVTLKHQPAYGTAYVAFNAGESLYVERDAMALMSGDFDIGAGLGGTGVGAALKRKLFGAENIVFGKYTALSDGGFVAVAPKYPGDVVTVPVDPFTPWNLSQGSLVAYADGAHVDVAYTGVRGVLAKEGIAMLRVSGTGPVIAASYGAIDKFTVPPGETLIVDSGHLVGFTDQLAVSVKPLGSLVTSLATGEGLVVELTGPGQVLVQTRAENPLRAWLFPDAANE